MGFPIVVSLSLCPGKSFLSCLEGCGVSSGRRGAGDVSVVVLLIDVVGGGG